MSLHGGKRNGSWKEVPLASAIFIKQLKDGKSIRQCAEELGRSLNLDRVNFAKALLLCILIGLIASFLVGVAKSVLSFVFTGDKSESVLKSFFEITVTVPFVFAVIVAYGSTVIARAHNAGMRLHYLTPLFLGLVASLVMLPLSLSGYNVAAIQSLNEVFHLHELLFVYGVFINLVLILKRPVFSKEAAEEHHSDSGSEENHHANSSDDLGERYRRIFELQPGFTEAQLQSRFREMIAKYHPDKVNHLGEEFIRIAEIRTKELNAAYEFLKSQSWK